MEKIKLYFQESYNELSTKVTWPTWNELFNVSVVVLVASGILALILFAIDKVINVILQTLIY
jgi:preprotein translocase subunit SecE